MKGVLLALFVFSYATTAAAAAPAKKEAAAFVKDVEGAVKANLKAIGGGTAAKLGSTIRFIRIWKGGGRRSLLMRTLAHSQHNLHAHSGRRQFNMI